MNKPQYTSLFSWSSTSLFNTLDVKKPTAVSKSGLELFMIYNNFTTTKWNNSPFFSLSCLASYFTSNNFVVAADLTNVLTSSPNISINSSKFLTILTFIVLSFIYIFNPRKFDLPLSQQIDLQNVSSLHLWYLISYLSFYAITCCHQHTNQWYIVWSLSPSLQHTYHKGLFKNPNPIVLYRRDYTTTMKNQRSHKSPW